MLFLISSLTLEGRSFKLRWEGEDDFKRLTANYSGVFLMRHWALLICHWFEPLKVVNACLFWKLKDVFVLKISAYQCVLPRWVTRTIKPWFIRLQRGYERYFISSRIHVVPVFSFHCETEKPNRWGETPHFCQFWNKVFISLRLYSAVQ